MKVFIFKKDIDNISKIILSQIILKDEISVNPPDKILLST